ncbi:MAG: NAD(P)H-dependent oxidoreductase [Limnohabitans sp.]|jgi:NAD(P)H dehydrogenase (quinone)|uniref:NAD(P)H-dependent oxidoreductase n=1 Tax=Limnohabitans sp. TaxID=1907725 RepID=UPI003BB02A58
MNVLIVHAHPEPQSFCTALKSTAVQELTAMGHRVQVSDLYDMGFNPVASAADFSDRANPAYCVYALEQRHGVDTGSIAPDIQTELDKLLWCDVLIFNFPLYWCSTPAILKGWIDRVFVSGKVYGGKRFYNHGGLKGKRAMLSVTLGGPESLFGKEGIHGPLEDMLKHLLQGTLAYAGLDVLSPFVAWHVPYISDSARHDILKAWQARLQALDAVPKLQFPVIAA